MKNKYIEAGFYGFTLVDKKGTIHCKWAHYIESSDTFTEEDAKANALSSLVHFIDKERAKYIKDYIVEITGEQIPVIDGGKISQKILDESFTIDEFVDCCLSFVKRAKDKCHDQWLFQPVCLDAIPNFLCSTLEKWVADAKMMGVYSMKRDKDIYYHLATVG